MSNRGMSAGMLAEQAKQQFFEFDLFELQLDSGTVYLNNTNHNILFDGNTFQGKSDYITHSPIEENVELIVSKTTLTLSGVNRAFVSAALLESLLNRTVIIYQGVWDSSYAVVANPIIQFEGDIDSANVQDSLENGTQVNIVASNFWSDSRSKPGRRTNHENQKIFFPLDAGLSYASEIKKDIPWGRR